MSQASIADPSFSTVDGSAVVPSTTGSQNSLLELKPRTFDAVWDNMISPTGGIRSVQMLGKFMINGP